MKDNLSSQITDSKNQIPQTRIEQLRTFFTSPRNPNKEEAISNIQSAIAENNKPVKAPLKKFINWYVWNISKKEIDQLYSKLIKYSNVFDDLKNQDKFLKKLDKDFSEKILHTILFPQLHPIKEVLFNYLYNFVLLPHYKNQQQFNQEMIWIIGKFDNFVKKYIDTTLYMVPTDTYQIQELLFYQQDFWTNFITLSEYTEHPYIFKIILFVQLPGLTWNIPDHKDNLISWKLILNYSEFGLNIPEILSYILNSKYQTIDQATFKLPKKDFSHLFIKIEEPEEFGSKANRHFQLNIQAIPAIENDISTYDFLYESVPTIEYYIEKIANTLSNKHLKSQILELLDLVSENLQTDESDIGYEILDTLPDFFLWIENKQIKEILQSKKNIKQKIQEIKNIVIKFFKRQKPDNFDIIDFNKTLNNLIDYHEKFEESWEDEWEVIYETNSKENKYLTKVEPTNLAPKLFVEKETEEQINYIINYLKNKDTYNKYLINPPKWAIFYGPAGTWKTETAKQISVKTWLTVYKVDISDILNMYVGESERQIKEMFQEYYKKLEKENALLYIDEGDGFFWKRDSENRDLQNWVRSIILQELEWFATNKNLKNGFILVSTNFLENIDKAIKERLGIFVKFDLPTKEKRKEYLEFMLGYYQKEKNFEVQNIDLNQIINQTENFSYRMLWRLLSIAAMQAVTNMVNEWKQKPTLTTEILLKALKVAKEEEKEIEKKVWFNI